MPARKKAVDSNAAALRSNQWFNVDFFTIKSDAGGPTAFSNALKELIARPGARRSIRIRSGRVDFHSGKETGTIIEGEFGRVRTHDTPSKAKKDCSIEEIELGEDEGITERTAFLYDRQKNMLVLHYRREALGAGRICEALDQVAQNREEFFGYTVALNPKAASDYENMRSIREVVVSYTGLAPEGIKRPDPTTKGFLDSMVKATPESMTVVLSAQTKKASHLNFEAARRFVAKALSGGAEYVDKVEVRGYVGDELRAIDLIEDRLRVSLREEVRGRNASYEQRSRIVREAYEAKKSLFG